MRVHKCRVAKPAFAKVRHAAALCTKAQSAQIHALHTDCYHHLTACIQCAVGAERSSSAHLAQSGSMSDSDSDYEGEQKELDLSNVSIHMSSYALCA
jgi:hypothetical protein